MLKEGSTIDERHAVTQFAISVHPNDIHIGILAKNNQTSSC